MRCPNCNYILVLLSHRQKYKCAKCSRLFPQKEIDNREFREYNKRQKQLDIENYNKELMKLKELRISVKGNKKDYYEKNKDRIKINNRNYHERNTEKVNEMVDKWHKLNKDRYLDNCRRYYLINKESILNKRRAKRLNDKKASSRNNKIMWLRKQQVKLTLHMLENLKEEASNTNILSSPPTILHYQLLINIKTFINTFH